MIFNIKKLNKLNDPIRLEWLPPESLLKLLAVENGKVFADIGAGSGYFTEELFSFVSGSTIYALDIQQEMIDYLKENMPANIIPKLIVDSILPLDDDSIDGLWSMTVYHEVPNIEFFLSEIKRVLKTGAKILLVDWDKSESACVRGPKYETRVASDKVIDDLKKAGFINVTCNTEGLKYHYAVSAEK